MPHRPTLNRDDAERYLEEIVAPTIADFKANPTSLRHAFLAAVATYHALDYMYLEKGDKGNKRKEFRDTSPAFGLIDRVAHAYKHVKAGNENDPNNRPLKVGSVIRRPKASIEEFQIGISRIGDSIGGVTLGEYPAVDLLQALNDAVQFLVSNLETEPK